MISILGLDKGAVLAALYNASRPQGMGFLHYDSTPMTAEEGAQLIQEGAYFDYLKGRVLKVNLSKDSFEERLYDRDNGQGAAARALEGLATGGVNAVEIQALHETGKAKAAEIARGGAARGSTSEGNVFHLGMADVAEELLPAIDKATRADATGTASVGTGVESLDVK